FFFSSRRRHTRFKCDWSSDVCSSDLHALMSGVFASALNTCRMSASTSPQSPMIGTSTRMFLLIEDGSMSMWIFFEFGENASVRPNSKKIHIRSEEHTSELQSHLNLVCRLLLEKKKEDIRHIT